MTDFFYQQLARFDSDATLAQACSPPGSWYTSADFAARERDQVFRPNWLVAGRRDQLRRPGDYAAVSLAGLPCLLIRQNDGSARAFVNVCRHRAAEIVCGAGNASQLTCSYHGWSYGLDGRLARAPELGPVEHFDREQVRLVELPAETWGPFVFVWPRSDISPPDLNDTVGPLTEPLAASGFEHLTFVRRVEYDLRCNWKVFVDNYLDGGYHVAQLHGGLAEQLSLDSYRTEVFARSALQTCAAGGQSSPPRDAAPGQDFAERLGQEAFYAWLYPNFMINRYGDIMDTNSVWPTAPDRCRVVFDYFFRDAAGPEAREFIDRSIAASHTVQLEDISICESVQRGLDSGAFHGGRYSVLRQAAEHRFHCLLAADLARRND